MFMSRPAVEAAVYAVHRFVILIGFDWVDIIECSIISVKITCSFTEI